MIAGGVAEGQPLFGFEDLVDAELGGVHLAIDGHLESCFALEEREYLFRLVAFAFHEEMDAVADGLLLLAEGIDALLGVAADIVYLAFLDDAEVADDVADFMTRFVLGAVAVVLRETS